MSTATATKGRAAATLLEQSAPAEQPAIDPTLLDRVMEETCAKLDGLASGYSRAIAQCDGHLRRSLLMADGIDKLRAALTGPVMARLMKLQGSSLGFRTDKDGKGGYDESITRDAIIEGLLRGVYPVNNEINIIASRCYITKEGYTRLVRELDGLTDLRLQPGVPVQKNGGVIVPYVATWKLDGIPQSITREIPIRVNAGMGADAILGKAERKILAAIYRQSTGSDHTPDGDVDDTSPGEASADQKPSRTASLAQAMASKPPSVPPIQARIGEVMKRLGIEPAGIEAVCYEEFNAPPDKLTPEQQEELYKLLTHREQLTSGGREPGAEG